MWPRACDTQNVQAHNSAHAACAFEGAAGQRATRARSAEGERTWIVLRDRAEARSKVGKSIAERAERTGEPCEPSVQSVQSVPMPGEEEQDLINLGVAAARTRCSGGAAGRARPRGRASAMARRARCRCCVAENPVLEVPASQISNESPNTLRFVREKFSEFPA